jgi:hypothetical protein
LAQRLRQRDDESGQSIVIIALMLTGLVAIAALVFDGGTAYAQRRQMQNAADAGAIAGARRLSLALPGETNTDSQVYNAIHEYTVTRNGAQSFVATYYPGGQTVGSTSPVPSSAYGVIVTPTLTSPTFFGSVLNLPNRSTAANAFASFGGIVEMDDGVYPIAVNWQDFQIGQTYTLFSGGGPGNFGWLGWTGSPSASALCTSLTPPGNSQNYVNPNDPNDHALTVGDWVQGTTGISNEKCARDALDYYISTGTPVTIVVWDPATGTGSNVQYHIAGFATFVIQSYDLTGQQNQITGTYVNGNTNGKMGATNYGSTTIRLSAP